MTEHDGKKKKVSISIDENIWEDAKVRISNRSKFIEECLSSFLYGDMSEEKEIITEMEELNSKLEALQGKLCALRESRKKSEENEELFEAPMISINRLHDRLGCIGKNQIKKFAKIHQVSYGALLKYVERNGLNITEFMEYNKNLK